MRNLRDGATKFYKSATPSKKKSAISKNLRKRKKDRILGTQKKTALGLSINVKPKAVLSESSITRQKAFHGTSATATYYRLRILLTCQSPVGETLSFVHRFDSYQYPP